MKGEGIVHIGVVGHDDHGKTTLAEAIRMTLATRETLEPVKEKENWAERLNKAITIVGYEDTGQET